MEKIKLKYVAKLFNGNSIPDNIKDFYVNKNIPYIATKDIDVFSKKINYDNGLSVNSDEEFKFAPKNSILMCIEGGSAGKKIAYTDRKVAFVNKLCCFDAVKIKSKLLYYCLQSQDFLSQFFVNITGLIGGVGINTLNNLYISMPQNEIYQEKLYKLLDEICNKIDSLIEIENKQIENLKVYKQSIISETVTKGLNGNVSYVDSGNIFLGNVPEHWKLDKVKFIASRLGKGNGITKEDIFIDGDTPCVRYGEIYTKYNISFKECMTRTNKNVVAREEYFEHGDILFSGTGELVEEIGKNIVYLGNEKCLAGGDIIILSHNQNTLFMSYLLNSSACQMQKSYGKAKLKVVHISATEIGNINIALPPIDEQNEIALFLENKCNEIDKLINLKQKKIEELNEYKKSTIYEYITGKRVL